MFIAKAAASAILILLGVTACASAQDKDAKTLFRVMEEKIRTAKTLQLHFNLTLTGAFATTGHVTGILILGEGDKYRVEMEGRVFGQAVKGTEVSDGMSTAFTDAIDTKQNATEKAAKAAGKYFRGALPRWGFFLCSLNMRRSGELAPDSFELSDFETVGQERLGERNTHMIRYSLKEKGATDSLSVKMWLDANTNLPVKLALTGGTSDWRSLVETYEDFKLDTPVETKRFDVVK